jgi:capsid protein
MLLDKIFGKKETIEATTEIYDPSIYDGQKFPGGLAPLVNILSLDYHALRQRSIDLFHRTTYGRGIVRRLVTNIINTGLSPECAPEEVILGFEEDQLIDWSENNENQFNLWANSPHVCDIKGNRTFGALQRQILTEAFVGGDCLVIQRQNPKTKLPQIQIVPSQNVETPTDKWDDPTIFEGVEIDKNGAHLGFWVYDNNTEKHIYIPAKGSKTGRLQAWLVYGVDKLEDAVRGEPLLAIAIQPIAEIDKYRDSAQRKAFLNAAMVGAVERGANNKYKSKPVTGGATKRGEISVNNGATDPTVKTSGLVPGLFFEGLQPDETVKFFQNNGVDANFSAFEQAILVGLAWALEIPPSILILSYSSNYAASQGEISEFKIYLRKEHVRFAYGNNDKIYQDWFLSMVLLNKIEARGYIEAVANPAKWDIARAWTLCDWSGAVKPSSDVLKVTNAYLKQIEGGLNTHERSCRELTGQKYSKVIRRLKKENQMKADAMRPLLELEAEFSNQSSDTGNVENNETVKSDSEIAEETARAAKVFADAYGVGVRAGTTTPQTADEKAFRKLMGLPVMSADTIKKWKFEHGTRQPITLAQEADNDDPENRQNEDQEVDEKDDQLEQENEQ